MYYPWLNEKWGYSVGVPVKNPILSDTVSQFWPWRNWAIESSKIGRIATWNPFSLCGYPLSPWFHTILFSPANIFYFLVGETTAMGLVVITQSLVMLLTMYFFIYDLLGSKIASLFGAISFSFSGFVVGWLTWGTVDWTLAFLPLMLLSSRNIANGKRTIPYLYVLFFSIVFSLLGGHPQTFFYVLLIFLIFFGVTLFRPKTAFTKTRLLTIILASVLAILFSSFVLFPSYSILKESIRGMEGYLKDVNYGFLPLGKLLILLFAPNFFGNPASGNYWGAGYNFQESLVWFGSGALMMMLFFLGNRSAGKNKINPVFSNNDIFALVIILLVGFALAVKYPFGILVYNLKIPLLSSASAARSLVMVSFAGAVLASFGVRDVVEGRFSKRGISFMRAGWLILVVALGLGLTATFLYFRYYSKAIGTDYFLESLNNLKVASRNLFFPVVFSGAAVGVVSITAYLRQIKKNYMIGMLAATALAFSAAAEGLYFAWKYTPFTKKELYFPETQTTIFLGDEYQKSKEKGELFRIEREKSELLPPNMWQPYHFYSSAGYDPVYPISYADYLKKNLAIDNYTRYIEWDKDKSILDSLGIKYFLVLKRGKEGKIDPAGLVPPWVNQDKWKTIFEEGPVAILENSNFRPPYFLVDSEGVAVKAAKVKLIDKNDGYWQFETETNLPGTFVLMENYSDGWEVYVNGNKEEILKIEGTFKGVRVGSGTSKVEFSYRNALIYKGLIVSGLSLLGLAFLSLIMKNLSNKGHSLSTKKGR